MLEKPTSMEDQLIEMEQTIKAQAIATEILIDHFNNTLDMLKIAGFKKDQKTNNLEITVDTLQDLLKFLDHEQKRIDSGEMRASLAETDQPFSTH